MINLALLPFNPLNGDPLLRRTYANTRYKIFRNNHHKSLLYTILLQEFFFIKRFVKLYREINTRLYIQGKVGGGGWEVLQLLLPCL